MANIINGANGAYSGKVGSVVGSRWRNVNYIRSLPRKTGKRSSSESQVVQRAKFALVAKFLEPISTLLSIGFDPRGSKPMSGFNAGLQYNLKHAVKGSYPDFSINYAEVGLSTGSLLNLGASVEEGGQNEAVIKWSSFSNGLNASDVDQAMILCYNEDKEIHVFVNEAGSRSEGSYAWTMPEEFMGDTLHFWLFFSGVNQRNSNTVYAGETVLY